MLAGQLKNLKSFDSKDTDILGLILPHLLNWNLFISLKTFFVSVDAKTYWSGFRLLGLPQGDIGGDGGGFRGAHGRFGPRGNDADWVWGRCWRDVREGCCLHMSKQTLWLGWNFKCASFHYRYRTSSCLSVRCYVEQITCLISVVVHLQQQRESTHFHCITKNKLQNINTTKNCEDWDVSTVSTCKLSHIHSVIVSAFWQRIKPTFLLLFGCV